MSIPDLYRRGEPVISFEFFPPKTDGGFRSLFRTIEDLKQLAPGFVSVTMGAGGSTRAKTVDLVVRIEQGAWDKLRAARMAKGREASKYLEG